MLHHTGHKSTEITSYRAQEYRDHIIQGTRVQRSHHIGHKSTEITSYRAQEYRDHIIQGTRVQRSHHTGHKSTEISAKRWPCQSRHWRQQPARSKVHNNRDIRHQLLVAQRQAAGRASLHNGSSSLHAVVYTSADISDINSFLPKITDINKCVCACPGRYRNPVH
jgi:hypothetical protein